MSGNLWQPRPEEMLRSAVACSRKSSHQSACLLRTPLHSFINKRCSRYSCRSFSHLLDPAPPLPYIPCRSRPRFLLMYLAAAVASTAASVYGSPNPSLGASGAIFGLGGALAVYFYRNRWVTAASPIAAWLCPAWAPQSVADIAGWPVRKLLIWCPRPLLQQHLRQDQRRCTAPAVADAAHERRLFNVHAPPRQLGTHGRFGGRCAGSSTAGATAAGGDAAGQARKVAGGQCAAAVSAGQAAAHQRRRARQVMTSNSGIASFCCALYV